MKKDKKANNKKHNGLRKNSLPNSHTADTNPIPHSLFPIPLLLIVLLLFLFALLSCGFIPDLEALRPKVTKDKVFTVSFEADGGLPAPASQTVKAGNKVEQPGAMAKTGFAFGGWFKEAACLNRWDFDLDTVDGDITLFAKWGLAYTVAYESGGGDGVMAVSELVLGVYMPLRINSFTRQGQVFAGWALNQLGEADFANGQNVKDLASVAGETVTLYAKWSSNCYTVGYDANGGNDGMVRADVCTLGANVTLAANGFTRTGYTFTGWNTHANGSGTAYAESSTVPPLASTIETVIILYAQWRANILSISYAPGGGTGVSPADPLSVDYGGSVVMPANPYTREGWTFSGWEASGTGAKPDTYTAGANLAATDLSSALASGDASLTLTAAWTAISGITVSFNRQGGEGEANSIAVTFDQPYGDLPSGLSRPGYAFGGWQTEANGGTAITGDTIVNNASSHTLHAKWTAYTLSISYNSGGGTGSAPAGPLSVDYGSSVTMPVNTYAREDCIFIGWSVSGTGAIAGIYQAGGSVWVSTLSTAIANGNAGITLTALWLEMVQITGGTFELGKELGTGTGGSGDWENAHTVTLSSFYIGKYQVTQEQWAVVMEGNGNNISATPSYFSSSPASGEVQGRRPVEQVSWYYAIVFCNRLSEMGGLSPAYNISGSTDPAAWGNVPINANSTWDAAIIETGSTGYRLPTEAQWEYAAKGGASQEAYTYSGSNTFGDVGWYSSNSNSMTHEVGKKQANGLGLYDMSGNVWEWCWDRYGSYTIDPKTDPVGAASGASRVIRGGYWDSFYTSYVRSVDRYSSGPSFRSNFGFRLARPE